MFLVFVISLWILAQIDDTQKYICMVSAATYYFDSNPNRNGTADVMTGFKWAYVENIGSICYGSLIMTIIRVVRFMVESLADSDSEIACIA